MAVNMTMNPEELSGAWRMDRIMEVYPAAHRALAETLGIRRDAQGGGPGYRPADRLADVAGRHGADVGEAIACILDFHARAQELEVTVQETAERFGEVVILDVREPRAFAMAHVPDSRCIDAALAKEIFDWPRDTPMVLVCHHGMRSLDAAEYFRDQGFTNVKSMRGGVDAWSVEIDPAIPRY